MSMINTDNIDLLLDDDLIEIIGSVLNVDKDKICNIKMLKKGMTNRSFMFDCLGKKYIMRIPGEGTAKLINREQEAKVYGLIKPYDISDNILYINPENGIKIVEYINDARNCNPDDYNDLVKCMEKLRYFHGLKLKADHEFNLFENIEYYESLWDGRDSMYSDYMITKSHIYELRDYIESLSIEKTLSHIDAICDNFLLYDDDDGQEIVKLIDWEYAGNQDPHVDIAMFCIYSLYDREKVDRLIDIYFDGKCEKEIRLKIYCYIAICGLLWSNWCEYKRMLGVEFGEYAFCQYQYAKDYYDRYKEIISGNAILG